MLLVPLAEASNVCHCPGILWRTSVFCSYCLFFTVPLCIVDIAFLYSEKRDGGVYWPSVCQKDNLLAYDGCIGAYGHL